MDLLSRGSENNNFLMPGTDCARFVPRKGKISQGIKLITWLSDRLAFFALGNAFFLKQKIGQINWRFNVARGNGAQEGYSMRRRRSQSLF